MASSQPTSSYQPQSQPSSQSTELADYLKKLREQSARENKINKYKRMIFEKNKNPNEYKATDFFPAIRKYLFFVHIFIYFNILIIISFCFFF